MPTAAPANRTVRTANGVWVERHDDVGLILLDVPDRAQNVLRPEFATELEQAVDSLEEDDGIVAIVLASRKPGSFMAGTDVEVLDTLAATGADTGATEAATALSHGAQTLTARIAASSRPIVAAVHGACQGAGLELAVACRERVATGDRATSFGSPEVKLGLIPGAGGTVRLPETVGLIAALELITGGGEVGPDRARRMGLVDEIVDPEILIDVAAERGRRLAAAPDREDRGGPIERAWARAVAGNPLGRRLVLSKAAERVEKEVGTTIPAPARAIDVIRVGLEDGPEAGFAAEARAFGELATSRISHNLRVLFLATEAAERRRPIDAAPRPVAKVGVVGAGLMGSGIAEVTSTRSELPVRIRDLDLDKLRIGLRSISHVLHDIRGLDHDTGRRVLGRITTTVDGRGFADVDLAIEAVAEDVRIKEKVLGGLEEVLADDAVIATNTSGIPLSRLAPSLTRPERLVGMHYFSPVGKIPLLEVVRGDQTSETALATVVDIGRRQGKTVVVVGDGPGFYTSRILGRYLNEAAAQAAEGVPVDAVDNALEAQGFAVGPFRLLDDVGIDVAHGIAGTLQDAFGSRFVPPPLLARLHDDGRHGTKNGRGLYLHEDSGDGYVRTDEIDPVVADLLGHPSPTEREADVIAERCLLQMADEAVRCLEEGVLASATDGDLAAVLGLGFPPQLGGPFRYLDDRGPTDAVQRMHSLAGQSGSSRWTPSELLVATARDDQAFHDVTR